VFIYPVTDSCK